jgi:hypothetical protein
VEDFDLLTNHGHYTTIRARGGEELDFLGFEKMMLKELGRYARRKVVEATVKAHSRGAFDQVLSTGDASCLSETRLLFPSLPRGARAIPILLIGIHTLCLSVTRYPPHRC